MRRLITRKFEEITRPPPPGTAVAPQPTTNRYGTQGMRVGEIPRSSIAYGRDLTQYESIFDYCINHGSVDYRDDNGERYVRLTADQEERYGLPRDPSRNYVFAHENARNMILSDSLEEPVWSWTTHANRDIIAWMPWRQDEPARLIAIGEKVLTAATRPVRNATLTQAGERRYFQPLFGLLYVGHRYR